MMFHGCQLKLTVYFNPVVLFMAWEAYSAVHSGRKCHFLKQIMEEVGGIILGHKAPIQHCNILQAYFHFEGDLS